MALRVTNSDAEPNPTVRHERKVGKTIQKTEFAIQLAGHLSDTEGRPIQIEPPITAMRLTLTTRQVGEMAKLSVLAVPKS
jgi:hypothetical protein